MRPPFPLSYRLLVSLGTCALMIGACARRPPPSTPAQAHASSGPSSRPQPAASPSPPSPDSVASAGSPDSSTTVTLRHERAPTSWLGVELRATAPEQAGVEVVRVLGGSPAEHARLRAGDLLTSLGGQAVIRPADVSDLIQAQPPGTTLPVGFLRDGQAHLARVHLEGMPDFEDRLRLAFVGKRAPEIRGVVTFQGDVASLKELRGQVVILEFWASFCGVCRVMAPMLDEWQRLFAPQGAQVFGITVDPPDLGLQVARRSGMSYPLASDPDGRVTRAYQASQIPTIIVIDKNGVVRDAMVGYSQERLLETKELIQSLLREGS